MLEHLKKKAKNLKITLLFYLFLYNRGLVREYIKACKDASYDNTYEGVYGRLSRGTSPKRLLDGAFSFARQMYVLHSNTDWWEINHDWSHSELFK